MDQIEVVKNHYNTYVEREWHRLESRPEFLLTCRMLNRYIKPGDKVLDIGGGPGRYSIHLAEKGCDVTLLDLSPECVKFAQEKAMEKKLCLRAIEGDAREANKLINEKFDHVLLMGPLYHLLQETDRVKAVTASVNLLKPGGVLFTSFIITMAGLIYAMKDDPAMLVSNDPFEKAAVDYFVKQKSIGGKAFTNAFFIEQKEISDYPDS